VSTQQSPSDGSLARDEASSLGLPGGALVLEPGKVIAGKYRLEKPAGRGGMAEVWVATNQATDAHVCVKILTRASDEESTERFRREAHAAAKLSHRAIVRVFDLLGLDGAGQVTRREPPDAFAIVMELLKGESLADLLAKRQKLPLEEALDLFLPVMSALAHAHRASVVHRDLKPDNIFLAVDPDGHITPKVLDFGLAKMSNAEPLTSGGVIVGTPSFMSPEQAKGRYVDARSDVFSAGTVLYVMLSGVNPFEERVFADAVEALLRREAPPLPDVPAAVWEVINRALEKEPQQRFTDATEMGFALRKAAGRRVTTDSQPSLPAFAAAASPSPLRISVADGPSGAAETVADSATDSPPKTSGIPEALPMQSGRRLVFAAAGALAVILVVAISVLWPRESSSRSEVPAAASSRAVEPSPSTSAPAAAPATTTVDEAPTSPVDPPPSAHAAPSTSAPKPARGGSPHPTSAPKRRPNIIRDPGF
jgi:serine/threonine-protein kinase